MGGFLFGDVAWSPFAGHGGSWRDGRRQAGFRGLAGRFGGGVSAVRAGLLARVMTAGAVRVTVSFGPAWLNVLGDLDLRARVRDRSRQRTGCPARRPFFAGAAARAASRVTPRVISVEAAQAAISWAIRAGLPERSIAPVPGPAPCSGAFASRSPVSDPSHRHL